MMKRLMESRRGNSLLYEYDNMIYALGFLFFKLGYLGLFRKVKYRFKEYCEKFEVFLISTVKLNTRLTHS